MKSYETPKMTLVTFSSKQDFALSLDDWLLSTQGSDFQDAPLDTYAISSLGE